ncbi:inverse autotransporter beta domain-containing protein, partial [bacterium endosymbiont of Bathymodiolus sp. 5 South]|uniref:inverse autotransporter beta domain-containing protein n=1 Tax=bacterium endosymbiont of Bathymodiolus sp. 5 South TaxID=1181670 RepID=UPI0015D57E2A
GFNLFTDYETKSKHRQASFGLEYMRHNFKANFNKYFTLSSAKEIDNRKEVLLSGYSFILAGQVPFLPWARLKTGLYRWNSDYSQIKTATGGLGIQITPSLSLEFGRRKGDTLTNNYASLTLKLPYSQNEKFTDFKISGKAFSERRAINLSSMTLIDRDNSMIFNKIKVNTLIPNTNTTPAPKPTPAPCDPVICPEPPVDDKPKPKPPVDDKPKPKPPVDDKPKPKPPVDDKPKHRLRQTSGG